MSTILSNRYFLFSISILCLAFVLFGLADVASAETAAVFDKLKDKATEAGDGLKTFFYVLAGLIAIVYAALWSMGKMPRNGWMQLIVAIIIVSIIPEIIEFLK